MKKKVENMLFATWDLLWKATDDYLGGCPYFDDE